MHFLGERLSVFLCVALFSCYLPDWDSAPDPLRFQAGSLVLNLFTVLPRDLQYFKSPYFSVFHVSSILRSGLSWVKDLYKQV